MDKRIPSDLREELLDMFYDEVGTFLIRGVTYGLVLKDARTEAKVKKYLELKYKLEECGVLNIFRVYELCNGHIFDFGLRYAQELTLDLLRDSYEKGEQVPKNDVLMLNNVPVQKRKSELNNLGKLCVKKLTEKPKDQQYAEFNVGLYNRNTVPVIRFQAEGTDGSKLLLKYDAFALKHTDLDVLNREILVPRGYRVCKVQPCEIFPTCTGAKFRLWVERIDPRIKIVDDTRKRR